MALDGPSPEPAAATAAARQRQQRRIGILAAVAGVLLVLTVVAAVTEPDGGLVSTGLPRPTTTTAATSDDTLGGFGVPSTIGPNQPLSIDVDLAVRVSPGAPVPVSARFADPDGSLLCHWSIDFGDGTPPAEGGPGCAPPCPGAGPSAPGPAAGSPGPPAAGPVDERISVDHVWQATGEYPVEVRGTTGRPCADDRHASTATETRRVVVATPEEATTTTSTTVAAALQLSVRQPYRVEVGYDSVLEVAVHAPPGVVACSARARLDEGAWREVQLEDLAPPDPSRRVLHARSPITIEGSRRFQVEVRSATGTCPGDASSAGMTAAELTVLAVAPWGQPPEPGPTVEGGAGDYAELQAALDEARALWEQEAPPDGYRMRLAEPECWCIRTDDASRIVEVGPDGEVQVRNPSDDGSDLEPVDVDALLDDVQDHIDDEVAAVAVSFDERYGFPAVVEVDRRADVADDETVDRVSWFMTR